MGGEERRETYGNSAVAADDGDDDFGGFGEIAEDFGDECGGADDVESCHTEEPLSATHVRVRMRRIVNTAMYNENALLRVKDTMLLEDLSDDGDGGVDGVGDDEDEGFGCCGGDTCGEIADDACVDLIVPYGQAKRMDSECGRSMRWDRTRRRTLKRSSLGTGEACHQ